MVGIAQVVIPITSHGARFIGNDVLVAVKNDVFLSFITCKRVYPLLSKRVESGKCKKKLKCSSEMFAIHLNNGTSEKLPHRNG